MFDVSEVASGSLRSRCLGRRLVGITGFCTLLIASNTSAQAADWLVKAQANGSATNSGYGYCGSSDGSVNCASTINTASGTVTYANGKTAITARGQAVDGASTASGYATSDLGTATIRQANGAERGSAGSAGTLKDNLTFTLPDPTTVYSLPFSYSFDGNLSGDTVGDYHPSLYAQSYFGLGAGDVASTQAIDLSGPAYYPPSVGVTNGSGQWTDVTLTQTMYGYSISGNVLIGGNWGDELGFDMQSQISCGDVYGAASCDYGHTQKFDFGALPTGVGFTSASGKFLTVGAVPGVPEPATWAMMIAGFGMVGGVLRGARRGGSSKLTFTA